MTTRLREPIRSTVEPSLVERRRQVANADQEYRRKWLRGIGALTVVTALIVAALMSPVFDVDHIRVAGQSHLDHDRIVDTSGIDFGSPLLTADLSGAEAALVADPWIAGAHIRRSYPGTVFVDIVEERPVLLLSDTTGTAVVSRSGRVLEFSAGDRRPSAAKDFQLLAATTESTMVEVASEGETSVGGIAGRRISGVALGALSVARNASPALTERLKTVKVDQRGIVSIALRDGATVAFGPPEATTAKLAALGAVLEGVDLTCIDRIDVRNPLRATVKRSAACDIVSQ